MSWFRRRSKPKVKAVSIRSNGIKPKRSGKVRIDSRKTAGMQRRYDRKKKSLRKSGYSNAYSKPISHMTPAEKAKLNKRIASGKYEVRKIVSPPKWEGEMPREWVFTRRK